MLIIKGGASPHNKRIELTPRGRHAPCDPVGIDIVKGRAGFTLRVRRSAGHGGPCSQLIRALYGQNGDGQSIGTASKEFEKKRCSTEFGKPNQMFSGISRAVPIKN